MRVDGLMFQKPAYAYLRNVRCKSMNRQILTIFLSVLTFCFFGQSKEDSIEDAKKEKKRQQFEDRRKREDSTFRKSVLVIGNVEDGVFGFEPGAATSVLLLKVLDSDSMHYIGQNLIIVVPGQFTSRLKKGKRYRMTVVYGNPYSGHEVNWTVYKDKNYKKMYVIDNFKAFSELNQQ